VSGGVKDFLLVCGVVKARATSNPWAAGSNPAGGESRRSSVVEQWEKVVLDVPAAEVEHGQERLCRRDTGMVESGVTSS
jgi:hypothetical protein